MNSDARLSTFPANDAEAIAFLYLKNQDLTEKTPEDLAQMYIESFNRAKAVLSPKTKEKKSHI